MIIRSYAYVLKVLDDNGTVLASINGVAEGILFQHSDSWYDRVKGLKKDLLDAGGLNEASVENSHFTTLSRLD